MFFKTQIDMDVDTWRWIKPISCDYSKIKPPQRYSQAIKHEYLTGITSVEIIGDWIDPMPCTPSIEL